jgi:outer membrane protein assembly factor BamB
LARLPLKTLWFGGLGPDKVVSRHFRTPSPLVINGRCFVSGTDDLMAMDIYNGRLLWTRHMPDLAHWPVQYRGPAAAVDRDAVYALERMQCLRLDPATGQVLGTYEPPVVKDAVTTPDSSTIWEYLAITEKYVVGTLGQPNIKKEWYSKAYPANHCLFVLDKKTRKTVWSFQPEAPVDSNAIAIETNRVFLIEGRPRYSFLLKNNAEPSARTLKALDLDTGRKLWETREVVPTQNSLWVRNGVIVTTINPFSRSLEDIMVSQTGGGACAYAASTGARLWKLDELSSCSPVIINDALYFPEAYDLHTGKPLQQKNPLTDELGDFSPSFPRACSALSGSPNLLMSRSGSLGFFDLAQRSGYYHYSITRASCYINMIAAGGLVVVPEGSSSCVCGYNYKMSLALVADDRQYSYGVSKIRAGANITQLRVNFGAPGDRADASGNIWYAWPRPVAYGRRSAKASYGPKVAGGELPIESTAPRQSWAEYSLNPDWTVIKATPRPWLYACGLQGPTQITVRLASGVAAPCPYRVTLHFCELDAPPSPRRFAVKLQGNTVLKSFNILDETGAPRQALAKSFTVQATDVLTLELVPSGAPRSEPIISGLEILKGSAQ